MRSLNWLFQLHLVAQEHEVRHGAGHGGDIGQGNLPRLINKQVVETLDHVVSRKQPGGSGDETASVGACGATVSSLNLESGMLLHEFVGDVTHTTTGGKPASHSSRHGPQQIVDC